MSYKREYATGTRSSLLLLFLAMLCFVTRLEAQQSPVPSTGGTLAASPVPHLIKLSGTLIDEQGRPLKSPVGVTFALYAQESGDAALWMETQNVEVDVRGNYSVLLGANSGNGVPTDLFNSGEARWLGVQAERQIEKPRILLVSVPYAMKAGDSQTLGGLPPSAFLQTRGNGSPILSPTGATRAATSANALQAAAATAVTTAVTTQGLTSRHVPVADGSSDIKNSQITDDGAIVVIGGCTPAAGIKLNVCGPLELPSTGTAVAGLTGGKNSQPLDFLSSTFNTTLATAVTQHFRWQLEPVGQNTSAPGGKLSLLYAAGTAAPAATGFSINNKGIISGNGSGLTHIPGLLLTQLLGNNSGFSAQPALGYLNMISNYVPPVNARAFTFNRCSWSATAAGEELVFRSAIRSPTGGTVIVGNAYYLFPSSAGTQAIFAENNDWFDLTAGQSYDFGMRLRSPSGTGTCSTMVQIFTR